MPTRDFLTGRVAPFAGLVSIAILILLAWFVKTRPATHTPGGPVAEREAVSLPMADECVSCHHRQTPAIVDQWARSTHAAGKAACADCHRVDAKYPTAKEHFGQFISATVTPKTCEKCHPQEVKQFAFSRHSLPSWTALVGYHSLAPQFKEQFDKITEVRHAPEGGELPAGFVGATRNSLYDLEDKAVTKLACQSCHAIGKPNLDGSIGNCNACHLRHDFSLAQSRKPETCSRCHIGPDHPQFEIYNESSHGILYHTQGEHWNWEQKKGRIGVTDFSAATCQVCHMSGFGTQPTTHDVGDRLSWYLFAEISTPRPNWQENRERMKQVCSECHSRPFINELYTDADALTESVNKTVGEGKVLLEGLVRDGLLTDKPFDHPLKFTAFDLWHHYGRTAKFGAWMQGPDYTQWHGIYPLMNELVELKHGAEELRRKADGAGKAASAP